MYKVNDEELEVYCKRVFCNSKGLKWFFWKFGNSLRGRGIKENPPEHQDECDVLILHPSEKSFKMARKQKLIDRLKSSGLAVIETITLTKKQILEQQTTCGPYTSSAVFRVHEGYANWLKKRYKCKLIITDRNGSTLSPFLKAKDANDSHTFHLAHSVTTAQSSRFSMLDYDYYCIYGKSSYEYLTSLSQTFGECKFILGGSVLFDESFVVSEPATVDKPVLFLGTGPEIEAGEKGQKLYQLVADWQKKSGKRLLVRLHQRSKGEFWKGLKQEGIEVLPAENFEESAVRCSMVLSPYTNAVVDAALLGRPSQLIAFPEEKDFLQVEKFYGPRSSTVEQIEQSVKKHLMNFDDFMNSCEAFAQFHLEHNCDSVAHINQVILDLVAGKPVEGYKEL